MTFTRSIKEELTRLKLSKKENLAEFSAFLALNGEFNKDEILFSSKNLATIRRFYSLAKELYNPELETITKADKRIPSKGYLVLIKSELNKIESEHKLEQRDLITQSNDEKRAYLRGAFLAGGSINDPVSANYHLEIYTTDKKEAIFLQRLMNEFLLNAKITKRRESLIVYLKEAEAISEFLKLVSAFSGLFKFEELRIQRDFNNSINRIINCEIANEKKTLDAANEQLLHIGFIKQYMDINNINPKIREIMELREENVDASLLELSYAYEQKYGEKISKSGINHRLNKIKALKDELLRSIKEKENLNE
jgi:DNA-binding protein WhiA